MIDFSTTYLGMTLRSPLVASASPLTRSVSNLRELEDAGVGAIVLPSLFEEQLRHDAWEVERMLTTGSESFSEASSLFPELDAYNTGPEEYLSLIADAKAATEVPVVASLNGTTPGGWVHFARLVEAAGADAIELNVHQVSADPGRSSEDIERDTAEVVADVSDAVAIPVAVKLSPFWSSLAHLISRLEQAGAAGFVLFNRFYQPDLDLESLCAVPTLHLSHSEDLGLPLRWIGLLRAQVAGSLAASSGVHTADDATKALLVGADVAMMTSALLHHGPGHISLVEVGLRWWMEANDYESIEQLKGSAASHTGVDPAAFERANYLQTLTSYSSESKASWTPWS